jgi:hypothetical protein
MFKGKTGFEYSYPTPLKKGSAEQNLLNYDYKRVSNPNRHVSQKRPTPATNPIQ